MSDIIMDMGKEALSKISYENALDFFNRNGLNRPGSPEKIAHYEANIQNCLKYL